MWVLRGYQDNRPTDMPSDMLMFGCVVPVRVPRFLVRSCKRCHFHRPQQTQPQYSVALGRIWLLTDHKPGLYNCPSWVVSINYLNKNCWCQRRSFPEKLEKGVPRERNYPLENKYHSGKIVCLSEISTSAMVESCIYLRCMYTPAFFLISKFHIG